MLVRNVRQIYPYYNVKFCSERDLFLDCDDYGIKEDLDWDLRHPVEINPLILNDKRFFSEVMQSSVSFICQNCNYRIPSIDSNFCENCGTKIVSLMVRFDGQLD